MAYDIFEAYYKKLEESITEKMSEEDRRDSDLLRSAIEKTSERTNAKLTPEEKAVLDKYNLFRDDRQVKIPNMYMYTGYSDNNLGNIEGGNVKERGRKDPYRTWSSRKVRAKHDNNEVNYADIARKRPARDKHSYDTYRADKITQYQDAQRELQSAKFTRDHHQRYIDNADTAYFSALEKAKKEYDYAVSRANKARDDVDNYHTPALARAKSEIDAIYSRFKK